MDAQSIATLITAGVGALGAAGTAVAWLVTRADKRREAGQDALITSLKEQIADLKALVATLRRNASMMRRTAGKWRDQLIAHDIDPDPSDWPEDTE